jgi:hypothetical protein
MRCISKGQLEHTEEVNFLIHKDFVSELGNYTEIVMSFLCGDKVYSIEMKPVDVDNCTNL